MILSAFTLFHVAISLVGIASGFVVLWGLLTLKRLDGWNALFLWTTVATSVTGFFFPVHHFMPSHAVGILSLLILPIAFFARYRRQLAGHWQLTYMVSAMTAFYFNFFVLIAQTFMKTPGLKSLAPAQSKPLFLGTQLLRARLLHRDRCHRSPSSEKGPSRCFGPIAVDVEHFQIALSVSGDAQRFGLKMRFVLKWCNRQAWLPCCSGVLMSAARRSVSCPAALIP